MDVHAATVYAREAVDQDRYVPAAVVGHLLGELARLRDDITRERGRADQVGWAALGLLDAADDHAERATAEHALRTTLGLFR